MTESTGHTSGSAIGPDGKAVEASAAFGVKKSFEAEVEAIRQSHSLNDEGKQAAIEKAYTRAHNRYNEAIERQEAEATQRVVAAEEALFKISSGHADYRAALDRAEYVGFGESSEVRQVELTRMMDRATLVGDERQAMAVFHVAVERGLGDLINRYLEVRPEKAKLADRLMKVQESEKRVKNALGWARSFPIRQPPELNAPQVRAPR
jgi:hypothetical protein